MKDKVEKILSSREWTFADLTNMSQLVTEFSEEIYGELEAKEKLEMIWDRDVSKAISNWNNYVPNSECSFGNLFYNIVIEQIQLQVSNTLKELLLTANVNFGNNKNKEDEINEISESSVGGKSSSERISDEKKSSKNKK